MNFVDTPICKSRQNCFQCRNNMKFREQMELQYGPWECPEGISIGTSLEEMPEQVQEIERRRQEIKEQQESNLARINILFDELESSISDNLYDKLVELRAMIFPNTKKANICEFGSEIIGKVNEECCGGKIKQVEAYKCNKHTITTDKKCSKCMDYKKKRN